jgi:hypothetical protein
MLTMDVNLLLNNPFQMAEPYNKYSAYIDLLLLANSKYNRLYPNIKYDDTTLQLLISEKALAGRWQWSVGKIRRYFDECEILQLLKQTRSANEKVILLHTTSTTADADTAKRSERITSFENTIRTQYAHVNAQILDDFVKYWTRLEKGVPRFERYTPFDYDEKINYFITHRKTPPTTTDNNNTTTNNSISWNQNK